MFVGSYNVVGSNNVGVFVNSASVIVGSLAALTTLYGGIYLIIVSVDTDVADGNTIILYFVLVLMSVIDNLLKGQSGQAIQNLNIMHGLESDIGLPKNTFYP